MIITSIDQVQVHVSVAQNVQFSSLSTYLNQQYNRLIIEWLGNTIGGILESIATDPVPEAPTDLQINNALLLLKSRAVVSQFGVLAAVPFFEVMFSESGITRTETEHAKTAYRGQVKRLEDGLLVNAFNALEDLLLFLDANEAQYPEWEAAPGYVEFNRYFFRSAREMNSFYQLKYGRVTFQKLCNAMQHIEDFFLETELGLEQIISLKALAREGSQNDPIIEKVVHNLKRAIVHLALSKAVLEGYIDITPNGAVFVVPSADNSEGNSTAQSDLVNPKSIQLEKIGMDYWGKTLKLMKANEEEFPEYQAYMEEIKEANKLKPQQGGLFMP